MIISQKGFAPIILVVSLLAIIAIAGGSYYLGKTTSKEEESTLQKVVDITTESPVVSAISKPSDEENWVLYKISALNMEFKLPLSLAKKYNNLIEQEINGKRGSQLTISFANNKSLKMTAHSPEFTPIPQAPLTVKEFEGNMGGPTLSVPAIFQGYKYEHETFYGIQTFGQTRELPKDQVTLYHLNGRDILKVKALYGDYGMVTHKIFPEDPAKIWGIINDTGNHIYQGLTVEAFLSEELTEPIFEQILSTFTTTK